jgi:hypothetical protein
MSLVVIDGVIIVLLAVTGLRRLVFDAVPMQLKLAITAGIGLFTSSSGWSTPASSAPPENRHRRSGWAPAASRSTPFRQSCSCSHCW